MRVQLIDGVFVIHSTYDERFRARATGAKWNAKTKVWTMNANLLSATKLLAAPLNQEDRTVVERYLRSFDAEPPRVVPSTTIPLKDHQIEMVSRTLANKRHNYHSDMGTGKTASVIGSAQELFSRGEIDLVIVVGPLSVLSSWERQIAKFCSVRYRTIMLTGTRRNRTGRIEDISIIRKSLDRKVLIFGLINYEGLRIYEQEILDLRPGLVAFDETTAIKNRHAKTTQACMRVSRAARYAVGLTGTPVSNNVAEIWSQCAVVSRSFFGDTAQDYWNFVWEFCRFGGFKGKEIVGAKNLPLLEALLRKVSTRVRKEDVLTLPERTWEVREVTLSGEQGEAYRKAEKDFYFAVDAVKRSSKDEGMESGEFRVLVRNALSRLLRCQQIASGHCRTEDGTVIVWPENPKLVELRRVVEESGDQRIVVFSRFVEDLGCARKFLSDIGVPCAEYHGKVRQEDRAAIERDLLDPKGRLKVVLAQVKTGGLGIDFSGASICFFLNNWFSWGIRDQAESRLHRPGQTRNVSYLDAIAVNTVDETVLEMIREKKSLSEVLFGLKLPEVEAVEAIPETTAEVLR